MRAVRRDETSRRIPGSGDDFQMTWAADDRQYAALCDGAGFRLPPTTFYNSRLIAVAGGPEEAVFDELATYPMLTGVGRHYGFGTLAVRGRFYQYLSGPPVAFPDAAETGTVFDGVKLIYSDDAGRTWRNQDGSTPVRWETYDERSRENLVFFREPNGAFALTSILQMGRDYAANRDGYVYVYSPGGIEDGTMNRLAMFRVPVDRMLDRTAYEYFVDRTEDGRATWSTDIARYGAVHVFPTGWVNRLVHPWAWIPSVAYVEPLGLYLMTSWGTGIGSRGEWFGKPSYLGIWAAERPWGPWTQILEEQAWTPGGDPGARAYHPVIAPKWIAADGRSFWLVWTDFQTVPVPGFDDFVEPVNRARATGEWAEFAALQQRAQPGYTFNLQRVDIVDETESRR
jgi:hypothetical protein